MLTVSETLKALKDAPGDARVYLPGGGYLRSVDVREADDGVHVVLIGDEEAVGTEQERKNEAEAIKTVAEQTGLPPDSPQVLGLAREIIQRGFGSVVPEPSPGNVVLTPGTATVEGRGG